MSSRKKGGGGGRQFSGNAPTMRRQSGGGGGGGGASRGRGGSGSGRPSRGGRGGRTSGMAAQAAVHGEAPGAKRRVRASRAQNAFGLDESEWDGESSAHKAQRYDGDPAEGSREYQLPANFQDEELDSDEEGIFNSDDEDKYGDVFAKSSSSRQRGAGAGADDDEEDEEDVDWGGAETINLSDMIDGPDEVGFEDEEEDEAEQARPAKKQKKLTKKQLAALEAADAEDDEEDDVQMDTAYDEDIEQEEGGEDNEEEVDEDEDDDEEQMSLGDEDDEADAEAGGDAHKSLLSFVSGLGPADDSAAADGGKGNKRGGKDASMRKPRGLQEQNEAFEEDLFAIPKHMADSSAAAAAVSTPSTGLRLTDLLKKMPSSGDAAKSGDSSSLSSLKKQLSVLTQSAHTRTLVEPLPEIRQEELVRQAQFTAVREEVQRWNPIINRNRDQATLSFPLNATPRQNLSAAELQTRFQPSMSSTTNSLEADLASLVSQYGLSENKLAASEKHDMSIMASQGGLSAAEVAAKNEGVAKMKALLFYQEQKAARIARIKSKTYRRLKKKQREKGKLSLEEMRELEPLAYEAEQRRAEQKRIEERMSLSHSTSSKWMAKALQLNKTQRNANVDVRDALANNARLAQELKAKQESFPKGHNSAGEEEDDSQDEDRDLDEPSEESDLDSDADPADRAAQGRAKQAERVATLRAKLAELEASLGEEEEKQDSSDLPLGFEQDPATLSRNAKDKNKKSASGSKGGDTLVNLKFMQKAAAARREETRAAIRAYEAELAQEEKRDHMRVERRRAGEEELDDEELDIAIASSMPADGETHGVTQQQQQTRTSGRRRVDANSSSTVSVTPAPASSVKLLGTSLQVAAAAGQGKGSKTRVDGPIDVPVPSAVGQRAAANLARAKAEAEQRQAEHVHPGQHHLIHGKSSLSVDTPFPSAAAEALFPVEGFSDEEGEGEGKATTTKGKKVDLERIKHDARASVQAARRAMGKDAAVRVGGMDEEKVKPSAAATTSEDPDANPWAQGQVANPRKAARMAAKAAKKANKVSQLTVRASADDNDDEDGEGEGEGEGDASLIDMDLTGGGVSLKSKRGDFDLLASGAGSSQADMVKRAFSQQQDIDEDAAANGVESAEAEFERLKAQLMEEEMPKEELPVTGLPGWGSWGGLGASNFKSATQLKKEAAEKARREARRAQLNSSRADAKLRHVILNEKVDSKALKFMVPTLPYPFTSVAQYEASLAQPVGREWNTTASFQTKTRPAVITKAGEIIEPAKFNPKVGTGPGVKGKLKARPQKEATKISGGAPKAGQKRKR